MKVESLDEKVNRLNKEHIDIASYSPSWPMLFEAEREYLVSVLPKSILKKIEHFGETFEGLILADRDFIEILRGL